MPDAVTIVLFTVTLEMVGAEITGGQIALGVVSFFVVSLGGLLLGVLCGLLAAGITKYCGELHGKVRFFHYCTP